MQFIPVTVLFIKALEMPCKRRYGRFQRTKLLVNIIRKIMSWSSFLYNKQFVHIITLKTTFYDIDIFVWYYNSVNFKFHWIKYNLKYSIKCQYELSIEFVFETMNKIAYLPCLILKISYLRMKWFSLHDLDVRVSLLDISSNSEIPKHNIWPWVVTILIWQLLKNRPFQINNMSISSQQKYYKFHFLPRGNFNNL